MPCSLSPLSELFAVRSLRALTDAANSTSSESSARARCCLDCQQATFRWTSVPRGAGSDTSLLHNIIAPTRMCQRTHTYSPSACTLSKVLPVRDGRILLYSNLVTFAGRGCLIRGMASSRCKVNPPSSPCAWRNPRRGSAQRKR